MAHVKVRSVRPDRVLVGAEDLQLRADPGSACRYEECGRDVPSWSSCVARVQLAASARE